MRIRSRLKIIIAVLIVFLGLLITVDVLSNRHLQKTLQQFTNISQISRAIFELNVLTNDYLLHYSERSRQQWWSVYKNLRKYLQTAQPINDEEKRLTDTALSRYEEMGEIFTRLISSHARSQAASETIKVLYQELQEREITRLLLVMGVIREDVGRLRDLAINRIRHTEQTASNLKYILEFLFLVIIIINAFLIKSSIVGPIEKIEEGTKAVGRGDFNYRIKFRSPDEIGRLAQAFDKMTENLRTVTASRDELEHARKELAEHAEELKSSNRHLEQFAYIASHDLQEPLNTLINYVQLLERRYKTKLDRNADTYINYINDSAYHMKTLISDLLTYSKTAHAEIEKEELDCNEVLHQVLQDMQATITASSGKITSENLPVITAHRNSLAQLFQNLIGNALKFGRKGEPIRIDIGCRKKGNEWIFSIKDNGIGIEPQYCERIFIMFQRLHTRDEYSGTGIGLAICKKIVESHNGRIWVESELNQGSTFYFSLPVNSPSLAQIKKI